MSASTRYVIVIIGVLIAMSATYFLCSWVDHLSVEQSVELLDVFDASPLPRKPELLQLIRLCPGGGEGCAQ